jgi:hypothetical protein
MKQEVIKMKRKLFFAILFLITAIFLFQACDLPTENDDNGEVCESYHYDVEITYERVKKITNIYDDLNKYYNDIIGINASWKKGWYAHIDKIGPNKYKILLKDVPVNQPRNLARHKQDMAILIRDLGLWVGQETDPMQKSCVVTQKVFARVVGKTGKVRLNRTQPASLVCTDPEIKEILVDLYCDGHIN